MKMTGHKTDSVFRRYDIVPADSLRLSASCRRYDIVSEGDLRDAAPKLDAGFAAKSLAG